MSGGIAPRLGAAQNLPMTHHVAKSPYRHLATLIPDRKDSKESRGNVGKAISDLAAEAALDDPDAVELLLNLSAGNPEQVITLHAIAALLGIYADKDTKPSVRTQIRQQSFALFELRESHKNLGIAVPSQVLYLAGQYAHDSSLQGKEQMIGSLLKSQINNAELQRESDLGVLSLGRFTDGDELLNASKDLSYLSVWEHALRYVSHDSRPGSMAAEIQGMQAVFEQVRTSQKPCAVYVNTGNHWVTAVVFPEGGASRDVHVLVIDSDVRDGRQCGRLLQSGMPKGLKSIHFVEGDMQRHAPNACGPLAVDAVHQLDAFLQSYPQAKIGQAVVAIKSHVDDWMALSPESQKAAAIVLRAEMLGCLPSNR